MPHQVARWRHLARNGKNLLLCGKDLAREPVWEEREIEVEEDKLEIIISGGDPIAVGASSSQNVVITEEDSLGYLHIIGHGQNVNTYTGASEPSRYYCYSRFVIDEGHEEEKEVTEWENGHWHTYKKKVIVGRRTIPCYEARANVTYYWEYRTASGKVTKGEAVFTAYATYVSYNGGKDYSLYSHREYSVSTGLAPNYSKVKAQSPVTLDFRKHKETITQKSWVAIDDDDDY